MLIELIDGNSTVIQNKTAEEIAAAEKIHWFLENAYTTLTNNFEMTAEEARAFMKRVNISDLESLWDIHVARMPKIKKVLAEVMEKVESNVQMVEDLVQFEHLVWGNMKAAWIKYNVVARHFLAGKSTISIVSEKQSNILLSVKSSVVMDLIKPLRHNLTRDYQLKHPNETVVTGRDLRKFKLYTYYQSHIPEYMLDNSNVMGVITYPEPSSSTARALQSNFSRKDARPLNSSHLMLYLDLVMITFLLAYLAYLYREYKAITNLKKTSMFAEKAPVLRNNKKDEMNVHCDDSTAMMAFTKWN
jgi:hypothetical protein